MANHLVQSVLYLGSAIIAILIIVALVARNGYYDDEDLVNTKAVYIICKPCEYKDQCKKGLADVAKNDSSTKKDYIYATFYDMMSELEKAQEKAKSEGQKNCETLLGYAIEDFNNVLETTHKTKIAALAEQADGMNVWLTAVRAYQTTCVEEIQNEGQRKEMKQALENANKQTFNSEKILYNMADILMDFGVDLGQFHIGHRRLLDEDSDNESESPTWFSAADRTLLGGGDDDEEEDEKKYFKKYTTEDYFKTPQPEKIKKGAYKLKANVVVSKDGSGDYKSIQDAIDSYPKGHKGRFVIYIMAGTYDEGQIVVNRNHYNVYMYGDGRDKTIITGDLSQSSENTGASQTATFIAQGERFIAKSIGFRNTAGASGNQAVAFRSIAPHAVMIDCSFEGYQNTIYYHTQDIFFKNCTVSGTVDIITGSGRAIFQDCEIYIRKPESGQNCYVTADGKMKYVEAAGVVLHRVNITAAKELESSKGDVKAYLGRPWKASSTAVVMQSKIGDVIEKEGWSMYDGGNGNKNHRTCVFREFKNKGKSGNPDDRVKFKGFKVYKDKADAKYYTPAKFMDGKSWLPNAGVKAEKKIKIKY